MTDEHRLEKGAIPHLTITGARGQEAVAFYRQAFAADQPLPTRLAEDGKRVMHADLKINGGSVMLADDFPEYRAQHPDFGSSTPSGVTLHLNVDDVDMWFDRAVAAGAKPLMPPEDMFWGMRYAQVLDPFGHHWALGAATGEHN